jgi:hypothetical protein
MPKMPVPSFPKTRQDYCEISLSRLAYDELAAKMRAAGYAHAIMPDGAIDLHGLGVAPPLEQRAAPTS